MKKNTEDAEKVAHEIKKGMYKDFIKAMKELEKIEQRKTK